MFPLCCWLCERECRACRPGKEGNENSRMENTTPKQNINEWKRLETYGGEVWSWIVASISSWTKLARSARSISRLSRERSSAAVMISLFDIRNSWRWTFSSFFILISSWSLKFSPSSRGGDDLIRIRFNLNICDRMFGATRKLTGPRIGRLKFSSLWNIARAEL